MSNIVADPGMYTREAWLAPTGVRKRAPQGRAASAAAARPSGASGGSSPCSPPSGGCAWLRSRAAMRGVPLPRPAGCGAQGRVFDGEDETRETAIMADWNDDTIARLRALWDDGHATAEIGRRMGTTKNAVVGKAHRLELPARPSPITRGASRSVSPRQRWVGRPTLPLLPTRPTGLAAVPPASAPAPLAPPPPRRRYELSGQPCCWPLGEPGRPGFRFCEEVAEPGRPYCAEHASLAYLPRPTHDDILRHPSSTG